LRRRISDLIIRLLRFHRRIGAAAHSLGWRSGRSSRLTRWQTGIVDQRHSGIRWAVQRQIVERNLPIKNTTSPDHDQRANQRCFERTHAATSPQINE